MSKRVVVTGAGGVSALGCEWSQIKSRLMAQVNSVRYMSEWDKYPDLKTRLAAPVDTPLELPSHYSRKKTRTMGRVAKFAVRAAELALDDAGLAGHPVVSSGDTGLAFGSATGSSDAALEFFHLLENNSMDRVSGTTYLRMMSHTSSVNISIFFGISGRMYTTTSACTAGTQGIGFAFEAIRGGQQKVMVAGGAEELCPTQAAVFDVVGGASSNNANPQQSPAPFDKSRDGLVLGEGGCALILEELEHARQRNAPILCEVAGFATNTDGAHVVRQNQQNMQRVMRMALDDAGLSAEQIGYVCAHGTATPQGDIAETLATEAVMGAKPFSSLKSYIGHSLGASGALEAWWIIKMMNEGWFAPTLNLRDIDPLCGHLDYLREIRQLSPQYVMTNNFAFGGINTSIIFKKYTGE